MITQVDYVVVMRKMNAAVVGVGYWGPNIIRNVNRMPQAIVTLACDVKKDNLQTVQAMYPHTRITTSYVDVLSDDTIDFVIIATPIDTHFALAKQALAARKHVMVEKPLTRTSREAKALIALAKKHDRKLFVGHTFVYNTAVKKIKKLLATKQLGRVYYYESLRANLGLLQHDANVIWDLAPHDLAILNYIFDEAPLSVHAFGSRFVHTAQEEVAHVFVNYPNNVTAHLYLSWLSPMKIRTVMIGCAKKMIVYDELNPAEKVRVYDKSVSVTATKDHAFQSSYRYGTVVAPFLEESEALYNELSHFVMCIRKNERPITGGEEGLVVVQMLEAAERSLRLGRKVRFGSR